MSLLSYGKYGLLFWLKLPIPHKSFELQFQPFGHLASSWECRFWKRGEGRDHPGFGFYGAIPKVVYFEWSITDNRHWDKIANASDGKS